MRTTWTRRDVLQVEVSADFRQELEYWVGGRSNQSMALPTKTLEIAKAEDVQKTTQLEQQSTYGQYYFLTVFLLGVS